MRFSTQGDFSYALTFSCRFFFLLAFSCSQDVNGAKNVILTSIESKQMRKEEKRELE